MRKGFAGKQIVGVFGNSGSSGSGEFSFFIWGGRGDRSYALLGASRGNSP